MAWALLFDGVNDRVGLSKHMVALSSDEWSIKFSLIKNGVQAGAFYRFMSRGFGDNSSRIIFRTNGTEFRYNSGILSELIITGLSFQLTDIFELRNTLLNGFQLLINSSVVYSQPINLPCDLGVVGENFGSYGNFGVEYIDFVNTTNTANSIKLNSTGSDHSGATDQPTLKDTVGGNDATGINFSPFDPSVWVNLGGDEPTFSPFWASQANQLISYNY